MTNASLMPTYYLICSSKLTTETIDHVHMI